MKYFYTWKTLLSLAAEALLFQYDLALLDITTTIDTLC